MLNIKEHVKIDPVLTLSTGFTILLVSATAGILASPYYQYSFIPAAAFLGLFLCGRYPHWGYYLIVALIPFAAFRGKIHWPIAFVVLVILLLYYIPQRIIPNKLRSNLWPWLLSFFIANIISSSLSEFSGTSFRNILRLASSYIFIAIGFLLISFNGMRRILPLIITGSISVGAFLAILGFFFDVAPFVSEIGSFRRGTGGATSPIALSMMVVFGIPILVHCLSYSRAFWQRVLFTVLLAVNFLAMVTTYSRGGALILVFILALLILEYVRKLTVRQVGIGIIGISVFVTVGIVVIPPSYWDRQSSLKDQTDSSISRRLSYLQVALGAFGEKPLIGSGSGTYTEIYARSRHAVVHQRKEQQIFARHAHNTYLEVLVGTGIIGLLIFIGLLWCSVSNFTHAKKAFLKKGDVELASLMGAFRLSLLSIVIYLMIQSAIDNKLFLTSLALSHVGLWYSKTDIREMQEECPRVL